MRKPLLAIVLFALLPLWAYAKQWSPDYELRVGKEAAAEVEKKWKVVTDEAQQKQLDEIATTIAAVCDRPGVKYTVKIIDEKEVNAFSLPGGFVYVTAGLLKDVQSVHELAGVLAHEITHNTFYDALERADKSKKLFMGSLATAIGALILGAEGDKLSAVLAAGEYIRLGVLSQYSMKVELRADQGAVRYLIASKRYDPVGMLTFMERLAAEERHKPKVELGVYADHPDTDERVRQIISQLEAAGADINRRAVTKWEPPKVEEKDVEGRKLAVLSLWGVEIMRSDYAPEGQTAVKRLEAVAEKLRLALADGIEDYQITADTKATPPRVMAGKDELIAVTPQDAAVAGVSATDLTSRIASNLGAAMHKENLNRWW
ncbi:M48 family metalloprotease [bacterium]|nr:M48 family metalloprotease [bacterium]